MPGHVDGFTCFASLTFGSRDPMTYSQADWRRIESDLRGKLKAFKLPGHETKEATLISMTPTATTISKHALALDAALAKLSKAKRAPSRRRPVSTTKTASRRRATRRSRR